ncbi:TetR/AcrR family transcriptional regulator [Bradyrhizobium sp.]|uniref:TetR/AcrR family transcriptional regulator n=1 Tax=Bradyrhizobium sp. TaxID=376 RepID=UPI0025BA3261|nr:TetR/AcrR family transcriptional regulator [Bradyrhizobium sp.]MBV8918433.1 TetR/AcrR family transcriptional regulator [Bradyrhizobium sp.]
MSGRRSPRDRLIDTAADLFYDRGMPNVGINEVTERAGVARMTLYNNFDSKEALALAAFEQHSETRRTLIEQHLARAQTPSDGVKAMFDISEQFAAEPGFRGCPFINVVVQDPQPEGPMHALVRAHKAWIRAKFRDIAARAGHRKPDTTAQQLLALLDGASIEAFIQGGVEPIRAGRQAAEILLSARR